MNVENKDNWTWFIDNLVADLDLGAGNGLVVISDQHKVPQHTLVYNIYLYVTVINIYMCCVVFVC